MLTIKIFTRLYSTPLIRCTKNKAAAVRPTTFVDELKVQLIAGKGGDGCIAFTKIFGNEYAGPDGGNGGNGGHIILRPDENTKSLAHIPPIVRAKNGEPGLKCNQDGKNAEPLIIPVPAGTIVRTAEDRKMIVDLIDSSYIAARGGSGGKGNKFFTTALYQAPKICEYGSAGEEIEYILEMATIAHVGLVGFPNAGKSTLLSALTRARPKVASYPFTTLRCNVGILPFDDFAQIRIADIPGLIDGASQNRGLGHGFLRHITRCICLIYIVDMTNYPQHQYAALQHELEMYDPRLLLKPSILIGNKIDLPEAKENAQNMKTDLNISGKCGVNLRDLITLIRRFYDESKATTTMVVPPT